MAGRPLRPATDRRLGGPSPRQPANRTRTPPRAAEAFPRHPPRGGERMRYQPRFLGVVPHPGAGCPRVPHPSAADRPRGGDPRDLHALGTPPALFLSQDQTLWQIPTWGISSLVVSPAARGGAAHDTVHAPARTRSRARPEAHAPLSTCQGPGRGGRKRRSSRAARGGLSIRSLVVAVARYPSSLVSDLPTSGETGAPRSSPGATTE